MGSYLHPGPGREGLDRGLSKKKTAPRLAPLVRTKIVPTGYPEFDALKDMGPAGIRTQYGLPEKKPVIFLSTACASPGAMKKTLARPVKRGLNVRFRGLEKPRPRDLAGLALSALFPTVAPYRTYLKALRELADRNGAVISNLWAYADTEDNYSLHREMFFNPGGV